MRLIAPAVALAALLALSACGEQQERAQDGRPTFAKTPEHSAEGKEVYYFDDITDMAKSSDYIVRGRVTAVTPGRVSGESAADRIYFRDVTVEVLETLKGTDRKFVTVEEEGWNGDGSGYVANGVKWSVVGDEAWYFLMTGTEGRTHLASSYGRFMVSGSSRGASGLEPDEEGPWHRHRSVDRSDEVEQLARTALGKVVGR